MRELATCFRPTSDWAPSGRFPVACASICLDRLPATGLIRLQGDPSETSLANHVRRATALELPGACRHVTGNGFTLAWTAPNEWLLFGSLAREDALLQGFTEAFAGSFVSATPLTDSRIGFEVSGTAADDFIAKGCAIDTRASSFDPGALAITRFAGLTAMVMRVQGAYRLFFDVSYQAAILHWMLDATSEWTAD
jgi:sarcosine oxidase subunit gamma